MSSRSYPIWHEVEACHYKSSKSYGGKSNSASTIKVGSSGSNSEELGHVLTTRRVFNHDKHGRVVVFKLSVDNVVLKAAIFKADENDRAGELIKVKTKMKRLKNLKV